MMRKMAVSDNDYLHLFDMCIDAEERCERRCHALRERGDKEGAAYEMQLRDKYSYLKRRIFQAMRDDSSSSLHEILDQLSKIGALRPNRSEQRTG
jgi:hypothetical protein